MKIKVLAVGKTDDKNLQVLIDKYQKRLRHYVKFEFEVVPDLKKTKNLSFVEQKTAEGQAILKKLNSADYVLLFDEKGEEYGSVGFARFLQKKMNAGTKVMCLIIGGPYGFSEEIYARANGRISLSKMTFSHQMIRLFATEQIYRAFTILKNEPYHHD